MILVLLPFCFCQLPDSFLLRLDVANHRPHSFAHHDGYHSLSSWVQSPVCLRGAPCHVRIHAVVEYGSYIALFDTLLLIVFCRRSADEKVPSVCWCICSWFFPTLLFCSSRSLWSLRWFTRMVSRIFINGLVIPCLLCWLPAVHVRPVLIRYDGLFLCWCTLDSGKSASLFNWWSPSYGDSSALHWREYISTSPSVYLWSPRRRLSLWPEVVDHTFDVRARVWYYVLCP